MAITQYTEPATTNPSLTDWQSSIARDNASSRGFAEVDLSSYADGATAPTVAVGSRFDNNGALYVVSGTAESISGIAGIAVSTTFYVYYDVSAGVFLASTTAPSFSATLRGWYNGNDRALFKMFKDSGGEYDRRYKYNNGDNVEGNARLSYKIIDIGDWNMDSSSSVSVSHGLDHTRIRGVSVIIRQDTGGSENLYDLSYSGGAGVLAGWVGIISTTTISLVRLDNASGGFFDQAGFDSTSYNRGWATIWYEPYA